VLEVGEPLYTRQFGDNRVRHSDVLHAEAGNDVATIIGDLATGRGIESDAYDCIILTQVLQCIFEFHDALTHGHRALRPGGVLLATLPGVSPISRFDMDRWGDYWRFTSLSAQRSFAQVFGDDNVTVTTFGSALSATAFIQGMGVSDLTSAELNQHDRDYEVSIAIRAMKAIPNTL